jgi:uncharacterized protein YdaL
MKEEDRYLVFADLLFDALAPGTPTRHRALIRLEDIDPTNDPTLLQGVADYLSSMGIPFGMCVSSFYRDPLGYYNNGVPQFLHLKESPGVVSALQYMLSRGGRLIAEGWTHQWDGGIDPFTGVTGDDFELYRVIQNADLTLTYVGPLSDDSNPNWVKGRLSSLNKEFTQAGMAPPTIFMFPHYAGSAYDYRMVASSFSTRWERALYFGGVLSGGTIDHSHTFGQVFPYVVRDVYGSKVVPENLGNIEPLPWEIWPARLPADIVNAANKNLVVRDGFASFYFHPYYWADYSQYLRDTVSGILNLGYTFVDPSSL